MKNKNYATREPLNKGIEEMMKNARRSNVNTSALNKEAVCPKCKSKWWESRRAVTRDAGRGGRTSKFNETTFEYFVCIRCGHIELPDIQWQQSREMRMLYQDFITTIGDAMKNNLKAIDPTKEEIAIVKKKKTSHK